MKRLLTKKLIVICFLFVLVTGWPVLATAGRSFDTLEKAYSTILDNYIEEPESSYLAKAALNGVVDMLNAAGKQVSPSVLDVGSISNDRKDSLKGVSEALNKIHESADVPDEQLEQAAIQGMVKALDPYSTYLTKEASKQLQIDIKGSFGGVGLQVGIKDEGLTVIAPIDESPAFRAGIKPGDRILKINSESTKGMTIGDAVAKMRGEKGTKVTLSITRQGFAEPREFEIARDVIIVKSVKSKMLGEAIGYVRISQFGANTANDVEFALSGMGSKEGRLKGLVLDLRSNPGGLLDASVAVADKFIDSDLIVYLKGRKEGSVQKFMGKSMGTHPPYPIIVLVNEGSASASEILSGALQDLNKAVIIGKRTFGKGNVQAIYPLPDGSSLRLTTAQYYLPSGRAIQGGIVPRIEVDEKEGVDIPLALAEMTFLSVVKIQGVVSNDSLTALALESARMGNPEAGPSASVAVAKMRSDAVARSVRSDVDDLPSAKVKSNKKDYAIVIGIEQYRQKLPPADFATQDARLVTEYLTKVMGYPEENVITLTNDRAGLGDFAKYFEKWLPNNVEPGSTVFIYYSGHGAPNPKTSDAYLVPYDGDPSFIDETGYSLKRLYAALGKLPAKQVIVAIDSCFSGAGGRSVLAKGARPLVMNLQNNIVLPKNMTVLSASSGDQISSTYDEKGHGLFTYFMLKGIKNEDVTKPDGSIKMDDLFSYIKPQVERIARKQYNNEQSPQLIVPKK